MTLEAPLRYSVLLVEDDPVVASEIKRDLDSARPARFEVVHAARVEESLTWLGEAHFDNVNYMSGHINDAAPRLGTLQPGSQFIQKRFAPTTLAQKGRQALDGT